jgi:hypothetical protein
MKTIEINGIEYILPLHLELDGREVRSGESLLPLQDAHRAAVAGRSIHSSRIVDNSEPRRTVVRII